MSNAGADIIERIEPLLEPSRKIGRWLREDSVKVPEKWIAARFPDTGKVYVKSGAFTWRARRDRNKLVLTRYVRRQVYG